MAAYKPRHCNSDQKLRMSGSNRRRSAHHSGSPLLHMAFFPVMLLWLELTLFFFISPGFNAALLYISLFSISAGALLWLVCSLFSEKVNFILSAVLTGLLTLYYNVHYFVFQYFRTYMPLATITGGAADVAGTFMKDIFQLVLKGTPVILILLVPFVLYLIFGRRFAPAKQANMPMRILAVLLAILLVVIAVVAVRNSYLYKETYWEEYNFNSAAQAFGLLTATRLDLETSLFKDDTTFVPVTPPVGGGNTDDPSGDGSGDSSGSGDPDQPDTPIDYGTNVLEIDFETLIAGEKNDIIKSLHQFVSSKTPSSKNKYTGMFEGKNLIFITAEAFTSQVIDPVLTPTLYRLANKGIQFKEYYLAYTGASTAGGEFTNLMSLMPTAGIDSLLKMKDNDLSFTIGNQLRALDYFSMSFHNHSYTYYNRNQTHCAIGYDKFIGYGNGMENYLDKKRWPNSDYEMFLNTPALYLDQQPFSVYYMTVSGHNKYTWDGNSMAKRNKELVEHLEGSEAYKAYLACNLELEKGLTVLVQQLEDAGIADDTVIVLGTDHYPYGLAEMGMEYLEELYGYEINDPWDRDRNTLIIWSGCLEDQEPIVVEDPVQSMDIVPTLLNLFGVEYDSRLYVGRDALSDAMPLVIWTDNLSWATDKGYYNAKTKQFTLREGVTSVPEDYVKTMRAYVSNCRTYSKNVAEQDYFAHLPDIVR